MPHDLKSLTPNLIVSDVGRSIKFYCEVLGFTLGPTVPDSAPYVFAIVQCGPVQIYLNAPGPATEEYPALKDRPLGGTLTLFIAVTGIRQVHEDLKDTVSIVMPLEHKWYGVTEFAFADPDGYLITYAEQDPS
jgi:lactoylglutathione lyase